MIEKPEIVKDEHLKFLDNLRISGVTNMFGSGKFLCDAYEELSMDEANTIAIYWMKTFREKDNE